MSNIQKHSYRVRIFLQFLFVVIPVAVIYYWFFTETPYDVISNTGVIQLSFDIDELTQLPLSNFTRALAALASLLLAGICLYALSILIHLFRNYEKGEIFTLNNARCYQKLGYCLFYWVLGGMVYGGLLSVILSFNNPPGERIFMLSFGSMDFLTIICGFIVMIISWVMKEGHRIADENSHTI